jgi:UDP-N-acetylmuramoyl-tripeptide--D-alanyl-D-alanine ligase
LAPQLLPSYLSAFTAGLLLGEDPKVLAKKLSHITPEKGRMNPLSGMNGSLIIDDSYNSNPESAKAALAVLGEYTGRKIAVLGSMNELGDYAEKGHAEVALEATKIADIVVTIGDLAAKYLYPVLTKKMNNKFIQKFDNSQVAGEYLRDIVQAGDTVLVKGSQNGVFAEEAIKPILIKPEDAPELLVRQGAMWQNKKGQAHE